MKKYLALAVVMILSAVLMVGLSGCSSAAKTTAAVSGNSVNISNFTFVPGTLTVNAGTTVTWTNSDSTDHHVVSDTGVFDGGVMSANSSYSFTFNNAGNFPYHCSIHTYMKGTIIVK
jgi:plastocyanin